MPLILAIEPDRRQAAQLSVVVRKRVGAELILVDTTERALGAIGNRMPDLVLVPALLSPQDDAALAAALRVIAAAARVQMLTIPVLGAPRPAISQPGVLSALRRGKPKGAEPDGCDPAVFAEQITSYLERAAQERPGGDVPSVPPVERAQPVAAIDEDEITREWLDPLPDETVDAAPEAAPDESVSFALEEAVRGLFADPAPPADDTDSLVEALSDISAAASIRPDPVAASRRRTEHPIEQRVAEQRPAEQREPARPAAQPDEWAAVEDLIAALQLMPLAAVELTDVDEWIAPAASSRSSAASAASLLATDATDDDEPPLAGWASAAVEGLSIGASGAPASAPGGRSEHEWVALIESLRHDVERLRVERAEKPARKPAKPPRPERAAKPAQDEWGFFDPEQCGFAALLAKLDEVTDTDDGRVNH